MEAAKTGGRSATYQFRLARKLTKNYTDIWDSHTEQGKEDLYNKLNSFWKSCPVSRQEAIRKELEVYLELDPLFEENALVLLHYNKLLSSIGHKKPFKIPIKDLSNEP